MRAERQSKRRVPKAAARIGCALNDLRLAGASATAPKRADALLQRLAGALYPCARIFYRHREKGAVARPFWLYQGNDQTAARACDRAAIRSSGCSTPIDS